jgi:hypothetical protein
MQSRPELLPGSMGGDIAEKTIHMSLIKLNYGIIRKLSSGMEIKFFNQMKRWHSPQDDNGPDNVDNICNKDICRVRYQWVSKRLSLNQLVRMNNAN